MACDLAKGFVRDVATALRGRCGVQPGDRVLVAVSGGADSVALLRALRDLASSHLWKLSLAVGHVNHHLRPTGESGGDARFVEGLATELDVPYMRGDLDAPAGGGPAPGGRGHCKEERGRSAHGNTEAWARRERYKALLAMARAFEAHHVAVAHHADDQLETLLMRLMRGASVRGLSGMAWRRSMVKGEPITLVRPMLGATHEQAVAYLRAIGQEWREDATNSDVSRARARLRLEVLPVLREMKGDAANRAVSVADQLRGVSRVLDIEIARACERGVSADGAWVFDRVELRRLPGVVLSGVVRRVLIWAGVGSDAIPSGALQRVVRAVRDGKGGVRGFEFAGGVRVRVERVGVRVVTR